MTSSIDPFWYVVCDWWATR